MKKKSKMKSMHGEESKHGMKKMDIMEEIKKKKSKIK